MPIFRRFASVLRPWRCTTPLSHSDAKPISVWMMGARFDPSLYAYNVGNNCLAPRRVRGPTVPCSDP